MNNRVTVPVLLQADVCNTTAKGEKGKILHEGSYRTAPSSVIVIFFFLELKNFRFVPNIIIETSRFSYSGAVRPNIYVRLRIEANIDKKKRKDS